MKIVFQIMPDPLTDGALTTRVVECVEDPYDDDRGLGGHMGLIAVAVCALMNAYGQIAAVGATEHPRHREKSERIKYAIDALADVPGFGTVEAMEDHLVVREGKAH